MLTKEELLLLKTKILPAGASHILDFLASKHSQVELTHIVLENVPLLIVGRHGMIARIPVNGTLQKYSQPADILEQLKTFFNRQERLYLFINLPDLSLPSEVTQVLEEVQERHARKEWLQKQIDEALAARDKASFLKYSSELNLLRSQKDKANRLYRRI
jgi:uncharacterized protein YpiB (UPF0302 family)